VTVDKPEGMNPRPTDNLRRPETLIDESRAFRETDSESLTSDSAAEATGVVRVCLRNFELRALDQGRLGS
jgi:predicted DNA-binding protein (UPF0251 family)